MTNAVAIAQQGSNNTTFRNRIINGAMLVNQRNGSPYAVTNGDYTLDRWQVTSYAGGTVTGKFTVTQSTNAPAGFYNSLLVTSTAATSAGSTDIFTVLQGIEGYNISDLGWGTSTTKTLTMSFWVKSSATGTFSGSLRNGDSSYSYPFNYTISSANTWEQKTVAIAAPPAGSTWSSTNTLGLQVIFTLQVSAGSSSAATGAWQAGNFWSATGGTNLLVNNGATWAITGVQVEAGTAASPFENRLYGTELQLCQRYYWRLTHTADAASNRYGSVYLPNSVAASFLLYPNVPMRTIPTGTYSAVSDWSCASNNAVQNLSDITLSGGANGITEWASNLASSSVANGSGQLRARNAGAWVALSAEL